jgi:hypothetical protein
VKSALPPDQLLQLEHLTLATIIPLETPEPSSSVTSASPLNWGMEYEVARRGESVTLFPSAEVYMTNILELTILLPCPRAAHV